MATSKKKGASNAAKRKSPGRGAASKTRAAKKRPTKARTAKPRATKARRTTAPTGNKARGKATPPARGAKRVGRARGVKATKRKPVAVAVAPKRRAPSRARAAAPAAKVRTPLPPPPQTKAPAPARRPTTVARSTAAKRPPNLDRARRTIADVDVVPGPPSSLNLDRSASAARSGRHEFNEKLRKHTSTGPALAGGDVDADWEDAESVGEEAPGGDNPTPDQDIVEEIGQALGVTYEDDEELQGGDELAERDRHRWELDPASKDDFDEE